MNTGTDNRGTNHRLGHASNLAVRTDRATLALGGKMRGQPGLTALVCLLALGMAVSATLDAGQYGYFKYEIAGQEVTITRYTGSDADVAIPDSIEGRPVTSTEGRAFADCSSLIAMACMSLGYSALAQSPVVRFQSRDVAADPGERVTFRVRAINASTLQWVKDGREIPGANSANLTIESVRHSDAGVYKLLAANSEGSVASGPFHLFVTPAPTIENAVLLSWPESGQRYFVQSAESVEGPWHALEEPVFSVGLETHFVAKTIPTAQFFRLRADTAVPESVLYADPTRFEETIRGFEEADLKAPPPEGAVVCIGSSTMRIWHERLAEDLAPLTVVPRGFGGSTMYDALHFVDRVVLAYRPRALLLYEGDNDAAIGIEPRRIRSTFDAFATRIHGLMPQVRIYVLAIKPSPARWRLWPEMSRANGLLQEACAADRRLTFIDVATPMLNANGKPRREIFTADNLHMNDAGYDLWAAAVRPVLVEAERDYEPGGGFGIASATGPSDSLLAGSGHRDRFALR